jgi:hypothetical protein
MPWPCGETRQLASVASLDSSSSKLSSMIGLRLDGWKVSTLAVASAKPPKAFFSACAGYAASTTFSNQRFFPFCKRLLYCLERTKGPVHAKDINKGRMYRLGRFSGYRHYSFVQFATMAIWLTSSYRSVPEHLIFMAPVLSNILDGPWDAPSFR